MRKGSKDPSQHLFVVPFVGPFNNARWLHGTNHGDRECIPGMAICRRNLPRNQHVSTIVVRFPSNPTEGVEVACFAQSPNLGASTMAMATQHSEKCISSIMPPKCPSDPDLSLSFPALSPRGDPLIFPDPYQSFPLGR